MSLTNSTMASTTAVSTTGSGSTTASTTTTATTGMPSNCGSKVYEIPVQDAACAMPNSGNHTEVLKQCCKHAPVETYGNKCGVYCLAIGQEMEDLRSCLTKQPGLGALDVFCAGKGNATATGTPTVTQTSTSASKTKGSDAKESSTSSATETNAAVVLNPRVSVAGAGVLAMMICSAVFGTF
ncbi:hypothetical protein KEM55_004835 [Ascosphaera atra]|nr:hypothetical protein KEM55_004835 [Ascosphaera atra]